MFFRRECFAKVVSSQETTMGVTCIALNKAYWRRVITSRYSRALFKGAADMQQELTACVQTLDPSRELALV